MKYVLMFVNSPDAVAALPQERQEAIYQDTYGWFEKHAAHLGNGAELQPPTTATTVRSGSDGAPVVVDGPFSEAKEVVGGFVVADTPDLDTVLAMARDWPLLVVPGTSVEVRPAVDHSGDM